MKQSRKANIIVIEGPDRVGKFTQTHLLKETLTRQGFLATVVEVPIRSMVTYPIIYWMLRNGFAKKFPKIFQVLQFLNRKIFQEFSLKHLEENYDFIIMDRWSLSTIVYGSAEGISRNFTITLSNMLRQPDHTIILYGNSYLHEAEDVYEADAELQKIVRFEYSSWAMKHPDTTTLIDCTKSKDVVAKNIKKALQIKNILP